MRKFIAIIGMVLVFSTSILMCGCQQNEEQSSLEPSLSPSLPPSPTTTPLPQESTSPASTQSSTFTPSGSVPSRYSLLPCWFMTIDGGGTEVALDDPNLDQYLLQVTAPLGEDNIVMSVDSPLCAPAVMFNLRTVYSGGDKHFKDDLLSQFGVW